jgi:lambda family phage portal protein
VGVMQRIRELWSPAKPARQQRNFAAGLVTRLSAGWSGANRSIDADVEASLEILRGRSRNLAANSHVARRYLQLVGTNVVGPDGFTMRARVVDGAGPSATLDRLANDAIQSHWWAWCQPSECDAAGRQSFADMCRVIVEGVARDGDALVRFVRTRESTYGVQLRLLDIDRLDTRYSVTLPDGNVIRMGVELTPSGRPVAYHLYQKHPNDTAPGVQTSSVRERVPASEVLHVFRADRPEQTRGYPWMHAVMSSVNMLDGFLESAVVNARVGAGKVGWVKLPSQDGGQIGDEEQIDGTIMLNGEPGTIGVLPQDAEMVDWSPDYPHEQFAPFVNAMMRAIASGLGLATHSLSGDMTQVNYTSSRTAELSERDQWMALQEWFISAFVMPVAQAWLATALLRGAITMPNGSALPAAKRAKFAAGIAFQGRRWKWVDPQKEANGHIAAIDAGLTSRTQVATEQGRDIEEVLQELAAEQARMRELGIELASAPRPPAPQDTPEEA